MNLVDINDEKDKNQFEIESDNSESINWRKKLEKFKKRGHEGKIVSLDILCEN